MDDLSATDRCVKCGLCLPHCPTFVLTGNEADSPRGRVSLMQWLEQAPEISPGLLTHIDRCLQCGACEAMCPSKVPFGALMDTTRARLAPLHQRGLIKRVLERAGARLRASPRALRLAGPMLGGYRRIGAAALLGKLPGTAGRLNRLLGSRDTAPPARSMSAQQGVTAKATTTARQPAAIPAGAANKKNAAPNQLAATQATTCVHLFPGCTGHTLDRQTLHDARALLNALGYETVISRTTACCGALDQHGGRPDAAAALATLNRDALDDDAPIISIASGCAAHLGNYDALDATGTRPPFSPRVSEITAFLARQGAPTARFEPCEHPVGVYVPCTQRNALRQSQAIFEVLEWIPGLDIRHLNPRGGCCGAAGSYMLEQPEFADALGDAAIEPIVAAGVRTLVTTNIGCSLQLKARLRARGVDIEVIHPVSLLWRQRVSD